MMTNPLSPEEHEKLGKEIAAEITKDLLSERTRKARRTLLGISVIAYLVGYTNKVPQKIPAINFEISQTNPPIFQVFLLLMTGFFLWEFYVYSKNDNAATSERINWLEPRIRNIAVEKRNLKHKVVFSKEGVPMKISALDPFLDSIKRQERLEMDVPAWIGAVAFLFLLWRVLSNMGVWNSVSRLFPG